MHSCIDGGQSHHHTTHNQPTSNGNKKHKTQNTRTHTHTHTHTHARTHTHTPPTSHLIVRNLLRDGHRISSPSSDTHTHTHIYTYIYIIHTHIYLNQIITLSSVISFGTGTAFFTSIGASAPKSFRMCPGSFTSITRVSPPPPSAAGPPPSPVRACVCACMCLFVCLFVCLFFVCECGGLWWGVGVLVFGVCSVCECVEL
jgi:hypothetical protein